MAVQTPAPEDTVSTDRIEKRVVLRAPRTRVWRALTNAAEFGTWFRVKLCRVREGDRKSTRLNSSHDQISYAVFCLKKKKEGPCRHRGSGDAERCASR